jgi:hypothetical protein
MSVHYSSAVWKSKIGDPVAKSVLLKLADNANDQGQCWPSIANISAETELSQRTIQTKIRKLESMKLLATKRGVNRCAYTLKIDKIDALPRVREMQGARDAGCISRHSTPQELHPTPQEVQLHIENRHRTVIEPSKGLFPSDLPFQSESFANTWQLWIQHRKELKKPITKQATKMALKELATMQEHEAIAAINYSIKKNWRAIYPDPNANNPSKTITVNNTDHEIRIRKYD